MTREAGPGGDSLREGRHGHPSAERRSFWRRWLLVNSLISGCCALAWLLLRSGAKPSRLAYPCQQAAFSTASLALGGPLVAALVTARRRLLATLRTRGGLATAAGCLFLASGTWAYLSRGDTYTGPRLEPPRGYRAQVFHVTDCPQEPAGERFAGLDHLITLMGNQGLKFYQSETESLVSGPEGIVGADDVVVIKINYQWDERGGTNTDLLRGLIRRIVDHPDGFAGEIAVCENTQFQPANSFDRDYNNAQDYGLSPTDVIQGFQEQGYTISRKSWRLFRHTQVNEYSDGDLNDGYVVYPPDPQLQGSISYPKFQTNDGTYISLRHGLWDPASETYDREHLKLINVPVLKSHHATYGATACVKNYMGVVTDSLGTNSHSAIRRGILGALLGEIQPADLNILDCIWINANPFDGPWTSYAGATRRDQLVASRDPVAADIWAVTNILVPGFLANGYTPPWPEPSADPEDPASDFREYLDNSMSWILAAGYAVTNDLDQIDAITWSGVGDLDNDGDVDLADLAAVLAGYGTTSGATYYDGDFDSDGDVDLADLATLLGVYGTSCP
jgi:hypothetical protein